MQRLHFTMGLSTDLDRRVLFETDSQDPPEQCEAEEPWGVFVDVLKVALAAAAKKGCRPLRGAAPPGADDAVCQAGAAQAGGAPAEAAPAKAAPARRHHQQERHQQEQHQQEAQRYTKR